MLGIWNFLMLLTFSDANLKKNCNPDSFIWNLKIAVWLIKSNLHRGRV